MAFIPLYDGNPLRYIGRPWVAWGLIAANVIIFFFFEHGGFQDADRSQVLSFGLIPALYNDYVQRPESLGQIPNWLPLFTYQFLHADFWHLAGNMVFLWVFADNIEDSLGHTKFFIFYIVCGLAAGFAYIWSDPSLGAPVIGASGAIAGIVAAYFLLYPYAKVWILAFGRIPLRLNALWVLGFWILFQVYAVVSSNTHNEGEGVAWWTHIGGLITGAILVLFMRRRGVKLFAHPPALVPPAPVVPPPAATIMPEPPVVDGPWSRR